MELRRVGSGPSAGSTVRSNQEENAAISVQPLCRSRVDLSIIGSVAEAVEAEVAVRGVEEDLRNL